MRAGGAEGTPCQVVPLNTHVSEESVPLGRVPPNTTTVELSAS